jgi:hypothetical protein
MIRLRLICVALALIVCLAGDSRQATPAVSSESKTPNENRLANELVQCLDVDEARAAIVDDSLEPYFSRLQRAEIAALTGALPTEETLDGCRRQARQRFQEAVRPFTDREAKALSFLAAETISLVRAEYPLLARQPWRFIKTADYLCGGFAWTRGPCIVLSQRHVERIAVARNTVPVSDFVRQHGPLLLHEQMHVIQRINPRRFVGLYTDVFGFLRADVKPCAWLTERQITNPDAVRLEWIFAGAKSNGLARYFWPRTILRTTEGIPKMGRDFRVIAVEVQEDDTGWHAKLQADGSPVHDANALPAFARRFPVNEGLDHPNEIAAYMFPRIVLASRPDRDGPNTPQPSPERRRTQVGEQFAAWCRANLR